MRYFIGAMSSARLVHNRAGLALWLSNGEHTPLTFDLIETIDWTIFPRPRYTTRLDRTLLEHGALSDGLRRVETRGGVRYSAGD